MKSSSKRLSTGISGLDEILSGGLLSKRSYLVRGGPGSGKTTIGLHFLMEGVKNGEKSLFISLEESVEHIRQNAEARGFDLKKIEFLDLTPASSFFHEVQSYDIFSSAEVEREPVTKEIISSLDSIKPTRVFLDPMTQFRYLSTDVYQFRRQVLSFLRYLVESGATVVYTSESSAEAPDDDLQFMSDSVVELSDFDSGRTICVKKFRGSDFRSNQHALRIEKSGVVVFPRLRLKKYETKFEMGVIPSGVPGIDELLNGGIERGTATLITGSSGVGKTTLGLQFMKESAGRGERSVVYTFEEESEIKLRRCDAINIPAREMIEKGTLSVVKIEPLRYSPDEFAYIISRDVEEKGSRVVMLDSVSGFQLSVRGEGFVERIHALTKYLQNMGVAVFLLNEVGNIVGDFQATEGGISYLADNIIFLRYLEINGQLRKAIGVLKKRMSDFEKALREFEITRYGIKVGAPLTGLRGVLKGSPEFVKTEKNDET